MKYQGDTFGLEMEVPNDGKRHVNPKSKRNDVTKKLQLEVEAAGGIWRGGQDWDNDQIDNLLNLFFIHCSHNLRGKKALCLGCGRSFDAIGTKLRKLASAYRGDGSFLYCPTSKSKRKSRTGLPWIPADYAVIVHSCQGEGLENEAYQPAYLWKILGRNIDEVRSVLYHMIGKKESGGLFDITKQEAKLLCYIVTGNAYEL